METVEKKASKNLLVKKFTILKEVDETNEESTKNLDNIKMKIDIMNYDEIYDQLDDLVFKENKKFETNQSEFFKTRYADSDSVSYFYNKLHKSEEFNRKEILSSKTPTFNFIESVKKYRLVPNPAGIVKRNGEENKISLK